MTLMNKFTHITKVKYNFEAELRGTNPGEIREIRSNSGKGAQNAFDINFGIGDSKSPIYAKIISPTGATSFLANLSTNQVHEIDFDVLDMAEEPALGFNIYPNPTNDFINIKLTQDFQFLRIINSTGKIIKELNINKLKETSISVNDLKKGYYLVMLYGKNKVVSEKLIIQ